MSTIINDSAASASRTSLTPLLVRASAGTGKTYRLAGRLLTILIGGADVETILATTFTRKAAGEILQRILITLAKAADDPKDLQAARDQVGNQQLSSDDCRRLLHRLMRDIHKLKICTLDSFFSQLARSFPFELHLPTGWRLSDEIEEVWMRRRAIDRMLASIEPKELATLVAMLGKGEAVRSVDNELQGIIGDGYSDSRWQGIEAWETLQVPAAPDDPSITSAAGVLGSAAIGHKSGDKILHNLANELVLRNVEKLISPKVVQDVANARRGDEVLCYKKPLDDDIIDAVHVAIALVKTHALGLLSEQTKATGQILIQFARFLDSLKQQTRVMAFDDVAFKLAQWISMIDTETLASRLDGAIHHVLLDEFQDTAPVQWSVLRPFAKRAAMGSTSSAGSSQGNTATTSFFCVGDVKQAIYGWRGGRAAIFDAVANQIPDVEQASQDLSFRSSPVITKFVTNVFQNLTKHPKFADRVRSPRTKEEFEAFAVQRFESSFPEHQSANVSLPGYVRFCTSPKPPKPADEPSGDGSDDTNPPLATADDTPTGLRYAATEIRRLELEAIALEAVELEQSKDKNAKRSQHTIAVLTRTNSSVAELIFYLKALGADVSQEGGNPLTDSALVEAVLSALMMAEHPSDRRWAYHVSHTPIGSLLDLPPIVPELADVDLQVQQAGDRVRRFAEYEGLTRTLLWLSEPLIAISSQSDAQRLRQLIGLSHVYGTNPQPRLSSFVDYVKRKRVERPRPARVRVMTIHQAKGLEFDTVVLPEVDGPLVRSMRKIITRSPSAIDPPEAMLRYFKAEQWSMLPESWLHAFGDAAAASMTEALCLLYVALTRPRHNLHIIVSPANKPDFTTATPASLLFHALGCPGDPTQGGIDLFNVA